MTAIGMIHKIKDDYVYILYMLFNMIVLIIFPGRDKRLLMPLFPFFIYFLLAGFSRISMSFSLSSRHKFENLNAAYIFAIGLILTSFLYISHETYKNIIFNRSEVIDGPYSPDSIELFNYIEKNTKPDDAIIFHKPRALSLYTGRKSFAISHVNFTPDKAYNSDAKYIVISKTI